MFVAEEEYTAAIREQARKYRAKLRVDGSCRKCGEHGARKTMMSPEHANSITCTHCGEVLREGIPAMSLAPPPDAPQRNEKESTGPVACYFDGDGFLRHRL